MDYLTGGAGADQFRFGDRLPDGDVITDFTLGEDILVFSRRAVHYTLPTGALSADQFALDVVTAANQFVSRAVAGTDLTELILDSNGTDPGGEYLYARFQGLAVLDAGAIFIN